MRALVRDQADNTLVAAEISAVSYDPLRSVLHLDVTGGTDKIIIPSFSREMADNITKEIFIAGCADLTKFDAWCNEVPVIPVRTTDNETDLVHTGMFTRQKIEGKQQAPSFA